MKSIIKSKFVLTITYSLLFAIGMQFFILPAGLLSTGSSGIVQIMIHFNEKIPFGLVYFLINVPGFILAYYKLGKSFTFYTILSVLTVTIFTSLIPSITFSENELINTCFGGILTGYSIGGLLKIGSSSGGLDIFGVWYFKKTGLDFKMFNIVVNAVIILIGSRIYGPDIALLTLLSIYFRNVGISQIFTSNDKLTVWIIGKDLSLVSLYIQNKLNHGTTHFEAKGGFSNEDKEVLMTILNKYEYSIMLNEIYKIKEDIFINVTETYKIEGNYYERRM